MAKKIKRPIKFIARKDLKANPNKVYLFGDNIQEKGYGGQAKEMRGEANAIGIPTKKAPNMRSDAFFTDSEFNENKNAIDKAFNKIPAGKEVVIPESGIGTGLADLKNKAPKTFKYIQSKLSLLKSHGGKKTVTNIPTKTSPQKKILFTGLDKADFKMGNKMIKVVREAVKKYGKNNVTLIHGGREKQSIIDKNIIDLGKYTGVKVEADPLNYSKYPKNAAGARTQQRIDDPDLEWHSFDKKGNLSLKDKYESWARKTYESLKEEKTYKIGTKKGEIKLRFPKKEGKSAGKPTQETSKFKSFLDILEDEPNQQKVASGLKHARRVSKWSEENIGHPLITEKNQPRLDYIEKGGKSTTQFNKELGINEPKFIRELPTGSTEYKALEDFGEKTYVETDRDNPNTSGKPQITRIKKGTTSPFSGKDISGKSLSKTMKVNNRGTLLAPRSGVRKITKSFEVRSYGTEGSTYDHKAKKAIPKIQNYTVNETKKISSGSKNPPPKKFVGGPETYSKTSSLSQFGNIEHAEPVEHREAQRKALQDPKLDSDVNVGDDKSSSGRGLERHKSSHLREQRVKEKLDLRDVNRFGRVFNALRSDFKKATTGAQRKIIDQRARTILTQMSDIYGADAAPETTAGGQTIGKGRGQQSVTITDVKSPSPHYERKIPKTSRIKASLKKDRANPFVETKATAERGTPRTSKTSKFVRLPIKNVKKLNKAPSRKAIYLPKYSNTENVTTEVTPKLKKITSTAKPKKKIVTAASTRGETVATRIQKRFATKPGSPNVEYKNRSTAKKHGSVGKGIKFTRGLGAFSLFSSILAPFRGRKEAKQMLKKHGIKRDPSVMETLEHTFLPKHARPKYYKIPDA